MQSAMCCAFAILLQCTVSAQVPDEVKKSIAALPPDQQVYEMFRYWVTTQGASLPGNQRLDAYAKHLRATGIPDAEAARQIALLQHHGTDLEVERWNRILTAEKPRFNTDPNAFLVEMVKGRTPGTALDVGMGQGRNAVWLARQGWQVTGFDPAAQAVALAAANAKKASVRLNTEVKRMEDFDFGENQWDLIVLSYVGAREIIDQVQRSLKPGGIVVAEAFHEDATREGPIGSGVVFREGELPGLFQSLRAVRYEEPVTVADFGRGRVRLVRYCGEKPL